MEKTGRGGVVKNQGVRNKGLRKKSRSLYYKTILAAGYELIERTMIEENFNKSAVAKKLGLDWHTLNSKINQYKSLK